MFQHHTSKSLVGNILSGAIWLYCERFSTGYFIPFPTQKGLSCHWWKIYFFFFCSNRIKNQYIWWYDCTFSRNWKYGRLKVKRKKWRQMFELKISEPPSNLLKYFISDLILLEMLFSSCFKYSNKYINSRHHIISIHLLEDMEFYLFRYFREFFFIF